MTIAKTGNKSQASGDGVTVAFSFPYRFFAEGDLGVYTLTAGVQTKKTLTTHYTVSNTGTESGGTVTFLVAPASGTTVTIIGEIPQTQVADYAANDAFPAETHETALDRGVRLAQQVSERVGRSIKVPASSTLTEVVAETPEAGAALMWNATANGVENGPTASEIAAAQGYATAASDSADDAAASAAAAATFDPANFQPIDATLTSLSALGTAADKFAYTTGVDTWAEGGITTAGRAILDDADAAAQRVTLGLGAAITSGSEVLTNADDADESGFWYAASTATNIPTAHNYQGFTAVVNNGIVRKQIAIREAADEIYYRRRVAAGTWSAWVRIANASELIAPGMRFIATADLSNNATADFTQTTAYDAYIYVLQNVVPATDAVNLFVRTSTDGGATFDTGASDYRYVYDQTPLTTGAASVIVGLTAAAQGVVAANVGSSAGEDGISGTLTVRGAHLAKRTFLTFDGVFDDASTVPTMVKAAVARLSSADVDAIRFLFSSGNLESGTITQYGLTSS